MRSYTVKEIDELRSACESRWLFGTTNRQSAGLRISRQYGSKEKDKGVEELVRTHMLSGHVAQDIYNEDSRK